VGRRGGRAPAVEVAPCPVGQAPEEDEDEEEVDEEFDVEPVPEQPHRGQNNRQQQAPSPPPNLTEVMAAQTQLLQCLAEVAEHRNNGGNHQGQPEEDLQCKIERFIRLKTPTFSYADDLMEADDWLRVIETKLNLTNCTDAECVDLLFTSLRDLLCHGGTATVTPTRSPRTSPGMSSLEPFVSNTCPDRYSARRPRNSAP
jgi:hypothetical protein